MDVSLQQKLLGTTCFIMCAGPVHVTSAYFLAMTPDVQELFITVVVINWLGAPIFDLRILYDLICVFELLSWNLKPLFEENCLDIGTGMLLNDSSALHIATILLVRETFIDGYVRHSAIRLFPRVWVYSFSQVLSGTNRA